MQNNSISITSIEQSFLGMRTGHQRLSLKQYLQRYAPLVLETGCVEEPRAHANLSRCESLMAAEVKRSLSSYSRKSGWSLSVSWSCECYSRKSGRSQSALELRMARKETGWSRTVLEL
eukprot:scpid91269/ scgid1755/ 